MGVISQRPVSLPGVPLLAGRPVGAWFLRILVPSVFFLITRSFTTAELQHRLSPPPLRRYGGTGEVPPPLTESRLGQGVKPLGGSRSTGRRVRSRNSLRYHYTFVGYGPAAAVLVPVHRVNEDLCYFGLPAGASSATPATSAFDLHLPRVTELHMLPPYTEAERLLSRRG